MIVLYEMRRKALGFELIFPKSFQEEPTAILEYIGNDDGDVPEGDGLDMNFHVVRRFLCD
jgi:hypothetical protein